MLLWELCSPSHMNLRNLVILAVKQKLLPSIRLVSLVSSHLYNFAIEFCGGFLLPNKMSEERTEGDRRETRSNSRDSRSRSPYEDDRFIRQRKEDEYWKE